MAGFPYPAFDGDTHTIGNYTWRYDGTATAWVGVGITAGTQGTQGSQGLQGIQGIQGSQGLQGIQGIQGSQGLQGIQGIQGSQGLQGIQGLQGLQGLQGTTGSQGLQGLQGTTGTGSQGLQGLQGLQGRQGTTGTGSQGLQGLQGNQGTTGTGSQGLQGLQGTIGNYGFNSGIFSKYHSIDGWTLGSNCGADEDGIFFFSACPGDCESGTCLGQYPTNIGLYIQTEEHFGGDLVGYFQNLYNNALGNGYWFIRYYTSDPSQASVLTTFISDNVDYPINIGGYDFIRFNGGICGPLPIDETIYSLSYYPYVP
jgi:hypothetical protein